MQLQYIRVRRRWRFWRYLTATGYAIGIIVLTLLLLVGFGIGRAESAGVRLQWDAYVQPVPPSTVAPADGFRVYRCQGTGCDVAQPPTFAALNQTLIGVTLTTYTDTTVSQGTTYCYVMTAVSVVAGDSRFSNSVCALLQNAPQPPLNLRGTAVK